MSDLPLDDLALALTPSTTKNSEFSQVSKKRGVWPKAEEGLGGRQRETLGSNNEMEQEGGMDGEKKKQGRRREGLASVQTT